jgi:hypothetical protein
MAQDREGSPLVGDRPLDSDSTPEVDYYYDNQTLPASKPPGKSNWPSRLQSAPATIGNSTGQPITDSVQ